MRIATPAPRCLQPFPVPCPCSHSSFVLHCLHSPYTIPVPMVPTSFLSPLSLHCPSLHVLPVPCPCHAHTLPVPCPRPVPTPHPHLPESPTVRAMEGEAPGSGGAGGHFPVKPLEGDTPILGTAQPRECPSTRDLPVWEPSHPWGHPAQFWGAPGGFPSSPGSGGAGGGRGGGGGGGGGAASTGGRTGTRRVSSEGSKGWGGGGGSALGTGGGSDP